MSAVEFYKTGNIEFKRTDNLEDDMERFVVEFAEAYAQEQCKEQRISQCCKSDFTSEYICDQCQCYCAVEDHVSEDIPTP